MPFMLMLTATIAFVGCGNTAPSVENFEEFKAAVQAKEWGKAHQMLSARSQGVYTEAKLQEGCEQHWVEIFGKGKVKNPRWVGGGESQQTGTIQLFNEKGEVYNSNAGEWNVVKDGDDWKVVLNLPTVTNDPGVSGEDPTGGQ